MTVFSSVQQLERISALIIKFSRLPFAQSDSIPGVVMEAILAEVRDATVLKTYDFIDVVKAHQGVGWQVKSTKSTTPVTWKRAKIPDKELLIEGSRSSAGGAQQLGDAIIDFCNAHALSSIETYGLEQVGYARLLVRPNGQATYFEKLLATRKQPNLFDPREFTWKWSEKKKTTKKEQLQSLHGYHVKTGQKWWAWHGLGENQLHFSGESTWWPHKPGNVAHFSLASVNDRMSIEDFVLLLEGSDS